MVEVGIPVYKARATLPKLLDSLVAQTYERFITCLSFDGDNEDYSDIIETYRARGLKIRTIYGENAGPGVARQRIIDTTQCDYIMFADADDMLLPRAVEILYHEAKLHDYDLMRSNFIHEDDTHQSLGNIMGINSSITWLHGKIYKVKFLREKNIRFPNELRYNEDAYFNVVVWHCTENKGETSELTYLWRSNKESLTRIEGSIGFFKKDPTGFILSQVLGMQKIYDLNGSIPDALLYQTIINIYDHYIKYKFYKFDMEKLDNILKYWRGQPWILQFFNKTENWVSIIQNLKSGQFIEGCIVFSEEPFNDWVRRLFYEDNNC